MKVLGNASTYRVPRGAIPTNTGGTKWHRIMARAATRQANAVSASNVASDRSQSLLAFDLLELQQYTQERAYSPAAGRNFHLFFVRRDDVHDILKHVLSRVRVSLYLNMFGYDDDELNEVLMAKATDPNITMLITLDKSQAGGQHEKMLLDADKQHALAGFNTHFVIGQSATHQISHAKGFVADGKVGGEGSVNWSASGEGMFVVTGKPGGPGYKAQNNTQAIFTDSDSLSRFQTELIAEHITAQKQDNAPPERRQRMLTVPTASLTALPPALTQRHSLPVYRRAAKG
jgi:hypothetical protein